MKFNLALLSFLAIGSLAAAQYSVRADDQFWRRRVILLVDLKEKINRPLVESQAKSYVKGADKRFGGRTEGMVKALIDSWSQGKIVGYKGDSLHRTLVYTEFLNEMQKLAGGPAAEAPASTEEGSDDAADADFGDFSDDGGDDAFPEDAGGDEAAGDAVATGGPALDLGNLEYQMNIIEDRIFDKGRSIMVHDIEYIRLVWSDPDGKVADRSMVSFKYDDILSILDETQWKNRFNDAEDRTIREIFDQRLFNGVVASVSQNSPNSLKEADRRRSQMIEFEHHLWSY